VVPPVPKTSDLTQWKVQLAHNIANASGSSHPDRLVAWISEAWKLNAQLPDLDTTRDRYQSLNGKLYLGIVAMLEKAGPRGKQLLHELGKEMQLAMGRGKILTGRHAVYMTSDFFRAFDQSEVHIGLDHLFRLEMVGNDLTNFQLQWESLRNQLPEGMPNERGSVTT
jgi:hypothetical protein